MIAQAKCTRGAASETELENDTFTGTVCVCARVKQIVQVVCVKTRCCPLQLMNLRARVRVRADRVSSTETSYRLLLAVTAANIIIHNGDRVRPALN